MTRAENTDPYRVLALAVVEQAIKDNVGKWFYESDWFQLLMPDVDAMAIYRQVQKNYEEYGFGLDRQYLLHHDKRPKHNFYDKRNYKEDTS